MMTKRRTLACWPAPWPQPPLPGSQRPGTRRPWPSKPIRWVVPFHRAGHGRHCAHAGREGWQDAGPPFVIENKPGAGGNIGADFVAKQPGDGYTLMITSIGVAATSRCTASSVTTPSKDFAPVSLLAVVPNVLVTNAIQPDVKTARDVIAAARKAPGKLTYASAGNWHLHPPGGRSVHLAGAGGHAA